MSAEVFHAKTELWQWTTPEAPASWYFLTLDGELGESLRGMALMRRLETGAKHGWGSVKVVATIGKTTWSTSMFPHKESGGYILPVKAAVRKAEGIVPGDVVDVTVAL